jgi:hypothetical protein
MISRCGLGFLLAAVATGPIGGALATPPSSPNYRIPYSVVGAGGGRGASTRYASVGTAGQPAIGRPESATKKSQLGLYVPGEFLPVDSGEGTESRLPGAVRLEQNYPNPVNPSTTIRFGLPADSQVRLVVHDVTGRRVATLVEGFRRAGSHEVLFDARGLPSGVYWYRLEAGDSVLAKRLVLLK